MGSAHDWARVVRLQAAPVVRGSSEFSRASLSAEVAYVDDTHPRLPEAGLRNLQEDLLRTHRAGTEKAEERRAGTERSRASRLALRPI